MNEGFLGINHTLVISDHYQVWNFLLCTRYVRDVVAMQSGV